MDKRLLSFDQMTGLSTYHAYDSMTDETTIITEGDYSASLEMNKKRANDTELTKQGIKNEMWLYASIPPIVQMKWLTEEGLDVWKKEHAQRLSRKLEDPEFRYLKTTAGVHLFK
jgi:hypothetical protein